MKDFEYSAPKSVDDALALLGTSWGKTEVLAGGTDLITCLKQGLTAPERVVSLKNVGELRGIKKEGDTLVIGATTKLKDFLANEDVKSNFPALHTAAKNINAPQMFSMGTVGGDLVQRPRCWYYRQGFGLLAQKDGKSLVREGDNRYHAIFGNSGPALFVNPSSLAPALIALGATLKIQGKDGAREVAAEKFFKTPANENEREYDLKPNELLTAIVIPMTGLKNGVYEIRQRRGLDWPMVAAAVAYSPGGNVSDARVVLGHVAPVPWRSSAAEGALNGKSASEETGAAAGAAAAEGASPLSMNGYKVPQVKVAVKRALMAASA